MTADPHPRAMGDLFSRDEHLTGLSLERFDAGELDPNECDLVVGHLRACSRCSDDFEEIVSASPLSPPTPRRGDTSRGVPWGTVLITSGLAAAALVLLLPWPAAQQLVREPPGDPLLSASSYTTTANLDLVEFDVAPVTLRVFGPGHERVFEGDRLRTRAPLRIELDVRSPGYVAVTRQRFVPGSTSGAPRRNPLELISGAATVRTGDRHTVDLPAPSATPGDAPALERLTVWWCTNPFERPSDALLDESCSLAEFEFVR